MSDPYGRNDIPTPPPKPSHFSLFRPFKVFFGFNFRMVKRVLWLFLFIPWCFGNAWKWAQEEGSANDVGPYFAAIFGYFIMIAIVVALCGACLSFAGFAASPVSWLLWATAGGVFVLMYLIYFAFKLDEEKSANHWTDLLLGKKME